MDDEQYNIMDVLVDDPPKDPSPEHTKDLIQHMRRFVDEHPSNPSRGNFDDWSDRYDWSSEYSSVQMSDRFGSWNDAVEAVGGDTNSPVGMGAGVYEDSEVMSAFNKAAEQEVNYRVDGEEETCPRGVAPPASHLTHIDSIEGLPSAEETLERVFGKPYAQHVVEDTDWVYPGHLPRDFDIDEAKETLRGIYESWDSKPHRSSEPTIRYINDHDDLPTYSALKEWLGPKEEWPVKLDLEEPTNADKLNLDHKQYFE